MVFSIRISGFREFDNYISRLSVKIPKALLQDSKTIAKDFQKGLSDEIKAKDLDWQGILKRIRIQKNGKKGYFLLMSRHGYYQDKMKPHWAPAGEGTILRQWIEQNFDNPGDYTRPYLFVRPTPFIDAGLKRGRKKIRRRLRNGEIARTFKKRG